MNRSHLICSLLIILCSNVSTSAQSLSGEWKITDCLMSGQKVPSDLLESMSLKLTSRTFDAKSGTINSSGKITNVAKNSPSQLTFHIEKGADSGREIKAIYELVDGKLKIAFSPNDDFPTEFQSSSSNQYALMTYESATATLSAGDIRRRNRAPSNIMQGNATRGGG